MVAAYAAAIDQGTTGTRFMVFGHEGQVIASAYQEHRQIYPQPGWVEHDGLEIWDVTRQVMSKALHESGIRPQQLLGIGVTNQRETTLIWDRTTGRPLYNAIVWQCTRTRDICHSLIAQGLEPTIRERTGLVIATYFSGPKIKWILDSVPGVREKAPADVRRLRMVAGDNVRYVVPYWLDATSLARGPQQLQLRVREPVEEKVSVIVEADGVEVWDKSERYMRPGEMVTVKLSPDLCDPLKRAMELKVSVRKPL